MLARIPGTFSTQTTVDNLLDLPTEILLFILVRIPFNRKMYASVKLVCRKLSVLVRHRRLLLANIVKEQFSEACILFPPRGDLPVGLVEDTYLPVTLGVDLVQKTIESVCRSRDDRRVVPTHGEAVSNWVSPAVDPEVLRAGLVLIVWASKYDIVQSLPLLHTVCHRTSTDVAIRYASILCLEAVEHSVARYFSDHPPLSRRRDHWLNLVHSPATPQALERMMLEEGLGLTFAAVLMGLPLHTFPLLRKEEEISNGSQTLAFFRLVQGLGETGEALQKLSVELNSIQGVRNHQTSNEEALLLMSGGTSRSSLGRSLRLYKQLTRAALTGGHSPIELKAIPMKDLFSLRKEICDTPMDKAFRIHLKKLNIQYADLAGAMEDELEIIVTHLRAARSQMNNASHGEIPGTMYTTENAEEANKEMGNMLQSLVAIGCYRRCWL